MYYINQHLKKLPDGSVKIPESFLYCTGKVNNEFYAWRAGDDLHIETTISDPVLLKRMIERYEAQEQWETTGYFDTVYLKECYELQKFARDNKLPLRIMRDYIGDIPREVLYLKYGKELSSVVKYWIYVHHIDMR